MPKFAHMSDVHIGAFRQPELKRLVLDAFEAAVDACARAGVDFVVISGDIFDSNIPDLASVKRATLKMKQAVDLGMRFYVVYGSHDFSPNYASIVDVLESAGIFVKAEKAREAGDSLQLDFVSDPTGAKICGISGKKLSMDREDYTSLERKELERERGFKIFVFHGALEEMKPEKLEMMEAMPASMLPQGFNYYAGGHVHRRALASLPGRANIAFPGPLFATDYAELEELARGVGRGFYIVDFNGGAVNSVEFQPVKVCEVVEIHQSAEGKSASEVTEGLMGHAIRTDLRGKVVLLRVEGQLSAGRTSDVDFFRVKKRIISAEPLSLLVSISHLTSKEQARAALVPRTPQATERELFQRNLSRFKSEEPRLQGERGVELSVELLKALRADKQENETRAGYQARMERVGLGILGLEEDESC